VFLDLFIAVLYFVNCGGGRYICGRTDEWGGWHLSAAKQQRCHLYRASDRHCDAFRSTVERIQYDRRFAVADGAVTQL